MNIIAAFIAGVLATIAFLILVDWLEREVTNELKAENDSLQRKLDMSEREKSVLIAQNETLNLKVNQSRDSLLLLRSQGKQLQAEVAQMKARHCVGSTKQQQ